MSIGGNSSCLLLTRLSEHGGSAVEAAGGPERVAAAAAMLQILFFVFLLIRFLHIVVLFEGVSCFHRKKRLSCARTVPANSSAATIHRSMHSTAVVLASD